MNSNRDEVSNLCDEISIGSLNNAKPLLELLRKNLPVLYDDLVLSIVFVDLTRFPIALASKTRTDNFTSFNNEYYDSLGVNMQSITKNSFIYHLIEDRNVIVVNDYDELATSEIGDQSEKDFITKGGMISSIFHTLFHEEVEFGYLALFTLETKLTDHEIDLIIDYFSEVLPAFSQKLLPAAYAWQQELHRIEIEEIQEHLSDLIISITSSGEIVRANSVSSFYLGLPPNEVLGKNLKDVSPPLYNGIKQSMESSNTKYLPVIVELTASTGQQVTLELNTWETKIVTDETIVCYATDISLLKIFQKN